MKSEQAEPQGGADACVIPVGLQVTPQGPHCRVELIGVERCHAQIAIESLQRRLPLAGLAEIVQGGCKVLFASSDHAEVVVAVGDRGLELVDVGFRFFQFLGRGRLSRLLAPGLLLSGQVRRVLSIPLTG